MVFKSVEIVALIRIFYNQLPISQILNLIKDNFYMSDLYDDTLIVETFFFYFILYLSGFCVHAGTF